jgi:hypothetical protein
MVDPPGVKVMLKVSSFLSIHLTVPQVARQWAAAVP